jgi:hypothetical protein
LRRMRHRRNGFRHFRRQGCYLGTRAPRAWMDQSGTGVRLARTCQPLIAARSVRYRSLRGSFAASQPGQQLTPEPNIVGAAEDVRAVSRECRDNRGGRRHRYTATVWFYGLWTPGPVPLSRLIAVAVTRRRIEEDHQLAEQSTGLDAGRVIRWMSWHRWTAICLLAYIYLAVAVAVLRQHEAAQTRTPG